MEKVWMGPGLQQIDLAEIVAKIKGKKPYFDRVRVWFDTKVPPELPHIGKPFCGRKTKKGTQPMSYQIGGRWFEDPQWLSSWDLFQPTNDAFEYLRDHTEGDYLINYLEITLDWITDTHEDARALQRFLEGHLIKQRRGQQHCLKYRGTFYIGSRLPHGYTRLDVYSDRPSKVAEGNTPCCHVEWTLQGSRRIKTYKDVKIKEFDDLLTFNHRTFWGSHLILRDIISLEIFGKTLRGQRRRKKPSAPVDRRAWNEDENDAYLYLRGCCWLPDDRRDPPNEWESSEDSDEADAEEYREEVVEPDDPRKRDTPEKGYPPQGFCIQAMLEHEKEFPLKKGLREILNYRFLPPMRKRPLTGVPLRKRGV
jgi:hypothetical protein